MEGASTSRTRCKGTCTFLGYARNRHAYRLVHRPTKRFLESRDVVFDEGGTEKRYERIILESTDGANGNAPDGITPHVDDTPKPTSLSPPPPNPAPVTARPKRNARAPTRDDDPRYSVTSYSGHKRPEHAKSAHLDDTDPRTFSEAMARPDAAEWEAACQDEMRAFESMGVYKLVPRPKGQNVVGSKWVFRIKRGPDGTIQKYKARVVAQGFTQVEGVDFDETFAPVAKFTSLRIILALAAELNMKPPPGFDAPDGMVLKLVKAVYGTKQGGRVNADHAVFVRVRNNLLSIIALYVDDITMAR